METIDQTQYFLIPEKSNSKNTHKYEFTQENYLH